MDERRVIIRTPYTVYDKESILKRIQNCHYDIYWLTDEIKTVLYSDYYLEKYYASQDS